MYLDDGLGAATGELKAADRSTLEQAGFVFNREKSIWKPTSLQLTSGLAVQSRVAWCGLLSLSDEAVRN